MYPNSTYKEIRKREIEQGKITYRTLADYVEDMVICNSMGDRLFTTLEPTSDAYEYYNEDWNRVYKEDFKNDEDWQDFKDNCENYEMSEIYQYFIINSNAADFLENNTDEIVLYDNELDVYVWGVTHCGTSWDYVFTNIDVMEGVVE